MYLAIDFWYWVLGVWLVSYIAVHLYWRYSRGVGRAILNILAFFGVIVHEFSHLIVTVICGLPVEKLEIRWKDPRSQKISPNGKVGTGDFPHRSFIKGFMICFAPLLVSSFLLFGCLDLIFTIETAWYIKLGTAFFGVSLILGASPSKADLSNLAYSIANDPILGLAQASCYGLSVYLGIYVIDVSEMVLAFEFMYYALYFFASILIYIMIFYSLKWTGRGIRALYRRCSHKENSLSNRSLKRKRIMVKKPPKEKEGEW